jgi:hypothetical protein
MSCRAASRGAMAALAFLVSIAACGKPPPAATEPAGACGHDGTLKAELYGGLAASLDWQADAIHCQGMPRPNGAGARLRFSGVAGNGTDDTPLAIILGIPRLEKGVTSKELPTNVTIIDEAHGRFFATQDTDSCWSDIERHEPADRANQYVVGGILYCVSPLAELHGSTSVILSEVRFMGLVDWKEPK